MEYLRIDLTYNCVIYACGKSDGRFPFLEMSEYFQLIVNPCARNDAARRKLLLRNAGRRFKHSKK
jgi:hypothetical protein